MSKRGDFFPQRFRLSLGFTLIELMVVVVIIGIASTTLMLRGGDYYIANKRAEFFAREFKSLAELARKQAIFSTNTVGMLITETQIRFFKLEQEEQKMNWKPISVNDPFWKPRPIPPDVIISWELRPPLKETSSEPGSVSPQIIFYPSGELTAFIINFRKTDSTKLFKVAGTPAGIISFQG